ncbi:hypothetical protein H634G_11211 [Metarhizium anisopliae BRIP 53293]|uniref:ATP-dependent DNA helicase n=1 Tax=Metarhizium anisopliae BRIP 53293 TaxID=1291518 RepID=A0A0D9NLR8_METAN|nr:hypothetical protein H634G_11211 [Metarhizium anisopliae BRIP 53293]
MAHPHRSPEDLYTVGGHLFDSFAAAYKCCRERHDTHSDDHYGEPDTNELGAEDDEFELEVHEEPVVEEDWHELARMLPDRPLEEEDIDMLGRRDIDIDYDWTPHVGRYTDDGILNGDYWKQRKARNRLDLDVDHQPLEARDSLHRDQRLVRCRQEGDTAAPTGVAGNQISGTTLHSLLHLPINKDFKPLSAVDKTQLQKKLKDIKYLIIDEKSMLGLRQLSWIDDRLREAFPNKNEEFFGGLNILLVGDFFQLPPVLQKPLYYDKEVQGVEIKGRNAYRRFDKSVFLKVVQRQRGDDQKAFRTALEELRLLQLVNEYNHYHLDRLGRPVIQDAKRRSGEPYFFSADNQLDFGPVPARLPQLTPTEEALIARVHVHVNIMLVRGQQYKYRGHVVHFLREVGLVYNQLPLLPHELNTVLLRPTNTPSHANLSRQFTRQFRSQVEAADVGPEEDQEAEPDVEDEAAVPDLLAKDTELDGLRSILAGEPEVDPGLATIEAETRHELQLPNIRRTPINEKIVPILPVDRDFLIGSTLCTRTQFPLIVCYAITVHKSQSITEDVIVTDLSCRDFQTGLSYVAVSRVKTLQGLMLDAPFDRSHLFYESPPEGMKMKMRDERHRRRQVHTRNPYRTDHGSA